MFACVPITKYTIKLWRSFFLSAIYYALCHSFDHSMHHGMCIFYTTFLFQRNEREKNSAHNPVANHSIPFMCCILIIKVLIHKIKQNKIQQIQYTALDIYSLVFWFCAMKNFITHIFQVWIVHRKKKFLLSRARSHIDRTITRAQTLYDNP